MFIDHRILIGEAEDVCGEPFFGSIISESR